jgi:hypothetical protein
MSIVGFFFYLFLLSVLFSDYCRVSRSSVVDPELFILVSDPTSEYFGSGSGFGAYLAVFEKKIFFTKSFMLEAAMLSRKLSSHFFIFS